MTDLPCEARGEGTRVHPPQINADAANASRSGDPAAEATPLELPATQGFKRTADGFLKGDGTAVQATARPMASLAHKRNKSMDTHRIGEVRGFVMGSILQGANAYAAIRPAQDASILRHGQGAERMGEAVPR